MFGIWPFTIILGMSLMMHAFDSKYLLVKVEEQRNELKGSQSTRILNFGIQMKNI